MPGAHALLDALEESGCLLRVLDLSSNELCGGTTAEDASFGAVKGSAARLSDDGAVCRLESDGLCSAGQRMKRNSGSYHVEFEVLQARGAARRLYTLCFIFDASYFYALYRRATRRRVEARQSGKPKPVHRRRQTAMGRTWGLSRRTRTSRATRAQVTR